MNPKIEKLDKEINKTKARIVDLQAKLREYGLCGDCPQLPSDPRAVGRLFENAAGGSGSGSPGEGTGGNV